MNSTEYYIAFQSRAHSTVSFQFASIVALTADRSRLNGGLGTVLTIVALLGSLAPPPSLPVLVPHYLLSLLE
jgi:hypothetical protein